MIDSASALFSGRNAVLLPAFRRVYALLVDELKCDAHVKTIYVGFSRNGEMLAAAYPRYGQYFELALPLQGTAQSALLYDAAHLKWRMLPVAVRISDDASFREAEPLIRSSAILRARASKT
jgi:hypothetical protein